MKKDSKLPTRIDRYKILKTIGKGGMAVVYLAKDETDDRKVALKVLKSDSQERMFTRIKREAAIVSKIKHPNVVEIFRHDTFEDNYFLAMQLVIGHDLKKRIRNANDKGRGLKPPEVFLFLDQMLDAFMHTHKMGIIHRDIKPANVLIDSKDRLYLTDFGIAKAGQEHFYETIFENQLTRDNTTLGTPQYMSPEQLRGKKDIDPRADIYSLGVVVYEMLVGRLPPEFKEKDQIKLLRNISEKPFPKLPEHLQQFQFLLDGMLQRNKELRLASAAHIKEFIEQHYSKYLPQRQQILFSENPPTPSSGESRKKSAKKPHSSKDKTPLPQRKGPVKHQEKDSYASLHTRWQETKNRVKKYAASQSHQKIFSFFAIIAVFVVLLFFYNTQFHSTRSPVQNYSPAILNNLAKVDVLLEQGLVHDESKHDAIDELRAIQQQFGKKPEIAAKANQVIELVLHQNIRNNQIYLPTNNNLIQNSQLIHSFYEPDEALENQANMLVKSFHSLNSSSVYGDSTKLEVFIAQSAILKKLAQIAPSELKQRAISNFIEAHLGQAVYQYSNGKLDEAATRIENLYAIDPKNGEIASLFREIRSQKKIGQSDKLVGKMVRIERGCTLIGSQDNQTIQNNSNEIQKKVCLETFFIGEKEVAWWQFRSFIQENTSTKFTIPRNQSLNQPAVMVSFSDAQNYAQWLSNKTGRKFRLPSEIEWEFAARKNSQGLKYSWGNQFDEDKANCMNCSNSSQNLTSNHVGSYAPNPQKLYNMEGNVWEWTCSLYKHEISVDYSQASCNSSSRSVRVVKGGSWASNSELIRPAARKAGAENLKAYDLGFRLVEEL